MMPQFTIKSTRSKQRRSKMKQKIEIEVEIPDGYEFDRYDLPREGENDWVEHRNKLIIIRPKRWRADKGNVYWTIDEMFDVISQDEDSDTADDKSCELGVYFRTEAEAEAMAEKLRRVLKDG